MALVEYASNTTPTMVVPDGTGGIWVPAFGAGFAAGYIQRFNSTLTARTDKAISATFDASASYGGVLGPDGRVWFTDYSNNVLLAATVTSDASTSTITRYTTGFAGKGICGICSDGTDLYVACLTTDQILKVTASTGAVAATISLTAGKGVFQVVHSGGNLFFTCNTTSQIGKCTTGGGSISYTNTPTGSAGPYGICVGPDGLIWYVEQAVDKIAKVTTDMTTTHTDYATGVTSSDPRFICSDGAALWFSDYGGDRYCKITTSGTVTPHTPTATAKPYGIAYYGDKVYFAEYNRSYVGSDTAGATQTISVGLATETDSALALTAPQVIPLGQGGTIAPSSTPPVESGSEVSITNDSLYNAFPGFCVAQNGNLLAAYTAGSSHDSADQVIKLKISSDGGATWGSAATVSATHTYRLKHAGLTTLSDGSIILTYLEAGNASSVQRCWSRRSTDNGVTWGSAVRIPTLGTYWATDGNMGGAVTGPCVEDPSAPGTLRIALHAINSGQDPTYCYVHTSKSTDYGATWATDATVFSYNGSTDGFEPQLLWVLKSTGSYELNCYIRSNASTVVRRSVSSDGGTTWGAVSTVASGLAAVTQPSVIQLPDRGIVMVVRDPFVSSTYYAHGMRLSTDDGASFGATQTIHAGGDAYGAWAMVRPGVLGHVYAIDAGPGSPQPSVTNTNADVYYQAFTVDEVTATERDFALPVTAYQYNPVGLATETDTAFSVTATLTGSTQTISVGLASETDSAQTVTAQTYPNTISVGLAVEYDEALSVTPPVGGRGYHWLRTRRTMSQLTKQYVALLQSAARTTAYTSAIQESKVEAGVMVFLNVSAASGTGGLTLRINAHDQVSGNAVALNTAPTAITATGTYSYALYPFGAVSGNVTQSTSAYLPRLFSVSVAVGDASSYTYSLGYCLLP